MAVPNDELKRLAPSSNRSTNLQEMLRRLLTDGRKIQADSC